MAREQHTIPPATAQALDAYFVYALSPTRRAGNDYDGRAPLPVCDLVEPHAPDTKSLLSTLFALAMGLGIVATIVFVFLTLLWLVGV